MTRPGRKKSYVMKPLFARSLWNALLVASMDLGQQLEPAIVGELP